MANTVDVKVYDLACKILEDYYEPPLVLTARGLPAARELAGAIQDAIEIWLEEEGKEVIKHGS